MAYAYAFAAKSAVRCLQGPTFAGSLRRARSSVTAWRTSVSVLGCCWVASRTWQAARSSAANASAKCGRPARSTSVATYGSAVASSRTEPASVLSQTPGLLQASWLCAVSREPRPSRLNSSPSHVAPPRRTNALPSAPG